MLRKIALIVFAILPLWGSAQSRNTSVEISDYREVSGKIVLELIVNGEYAEFLLDLAGEFAVLPEHASRLKVETPDSSPERTSFLNKSVGVSSRGKVANVSFGNSVFKNDYPVWILADGADIRELGVAGVIGGDLFRNVVLTIDTKRKKITTSRPYCPPYMRLNRRVNFELIPGSGVVFEIGIAGQTFSVLLDNTKDGRLCLTTDDFARLASGEEGSAVSTVNFVRSELQDVNILRDASLTRSVMGGGVLNEGLISIDYERKKIYFQSFDEEKVVDEVLTSTVNVEAGRLNAITRDYFIDHVYNYKVGKEFVFKGDKPVVIDFWATWCGPCMKLMPEMERLAMEYKDRVVFYKVNADKEKELCNILNVSALPTLFFIPVGGKPIVRVGALPEEFKKIIEEELLKK